MPEDRDPWERPLEEAPRQRTPRLAVLIMLGGLVGVFASGIGFDLFGQPIAFTDIGTYLFFGSIWFGVFGLALAFLSVQGAFKSTVVTAAAFLLIFIAGKLSRSAL